MLQHLQRADQACCHPPTVNSTWQLNLGTAHVQTSKLAKVPVDTQQV
jgi:hypothetical protein